MSVNIQLWLRGVALVFVTVPIRDDRDLGVCSKSGRKVRSCYISVAGSGCQLLECWYCQKKRTITDEILCAGTTRIGGGNGIEESEHRDFIRSGFVTFGCRRLIERTRVTTCGSGRVARNKGVGVSG